MDQVGRALKPVIDSSGKLSPSEPFVLLRRLQRVKCDVLHRKAGKIAPQITIKRLVWNEQNGLEGTNAKNLTFQHALPNGSSQAISVYDYFMKKYQIRLRYPSWPVLETFRGEFIPMELCLIAENQRYAPKLDPEQVNWL